MKLAVRSSLARDSQRCFCVGWWGSRGDREDQLPLQRKSAGARVNDPPACPIRVSVYLPPLPVTVPRVITCRFWTLVTLLTARFRYDRSCRAV